MYVEGFISSLFLKTMISESQGSRYKIITIFRKMAEYRIICRAKDKATLLQEVRDSWINGVSVKIAGKWNLDLSFYLLHYFT